MTELSPEMVTRRKELARDAVEIVTEISDRADAMRLGLAKYPVADVRRVLHALDAEREQSKRWEQAHEALRLALGEALDQRDAERRRVAGLEKALRECAKRPDVSEPVTIYWQGLLAELNRRADIARAALEEKP